MKQSDNESNQNQSTRASEPGEMMPAMDRMPATEDRKNPFFIRPEMLARGIVTGVSVSIITQTGRKLVGRLFGNPPFLFGLGLASGYLAHKYRKEIIATAGSAAQQGSEFVLRQSENIKEMLVKTRGTDISE
ncbi:MAG: hypothetical protein NTX45_11395 [Proteobacteria bacterium]|nr:hypothetical protein [Pseudomonadota bacterium]